MFLALFEPGVQMNRIVSVVLAVGVLVFLLVQCIRPAIPYGPATAEILVPTDVKAVLKRDCYSCHSDERRLAWFDEIQPAYWLARKDILDARSRLNFSTIGSQPEALQKAALYEAVAMMQLGAMPLPRYLSVHPEARVTPQDLETIKDYLSPWSSPIPPLVGSASGASTLAVKPPRGSKPSLNGIPYDDSWRGWKLLAVTNRGDNRQFRMILGNDVAAKAAQEGDIHPWPDGTRFVKLAWLQQQTPDGLVVPGEFWQIEMMIKDAGRFRGTDGWGWARWRGVDLRPYGKDAAFVNECTGCHLPLRGNDYVYTLPISSAGAQGDEVLDNAAARLPKGLASNPLSWSPVTIYSDPQKHTISVLFADTKEIGAGVTPAAGGPEVALVTWTERDDPHWFGARIADTVVSVEIVRINSSKETTHKRFSGDGFAGADAESPTTARSSFITNLHPVQLP
jgi:hypothetical protein